MGDAVFSYWEHQTFLREADVVVVGGGIVGLSAAIFTRQLRPQARVVVLERAVLPTGASTKNAGFACFGSISELMEQERKGGAAGLQQVVQARWQGLALLRELVGDEALHYQPVGGYELFQHAERELAEECRAKVPYYNELLADVIGTTGIFADATSRRAEFNFGNVQTILENRAEGCLDTGRMMLALLRLAWQEGVIVLPGCPVMALESQPGGVGLTTALGSLTADKVLLATNAFSAHFFPELDVQPGRGQVLVTEPIPGLHLPGTFHYDKGYYYFRQVGDRLLLGGGRHLDFAAEATTAPGLTSLVQQTLEQLITDVILPGKRPRIDYRWSGVMAFGRELEPIIRPLAPGIFGAMRCNGMGVAMGALSGRKAAELISN
ncbi:FAD-binding oxidoreductase [Hymenobacter sp. BT175]|uniref:NAD(P)/FAD-dependent oxidoreductase n=1 Tax=Hymenobacter translucens TaxID=2886507 RepID=UPI001D0EA6D1|nr:FAD-binding oxidoreductase [Hymenobacter translucens]MCC2545803.1 FAD-binding oxidoreductase [Hymenobacter translucens]